MPCLTAPEEAEEGAEPKPPKPAPKMSPLIVENTMREKRCKFFGIPKLGAYVAVPFAFQSIDHENGCVFNPGDAENFVAPSYQLVKLETHFIIGIDTIGKYRLFKVYMLALWYYLYLRAALCYSLTRSLASTSWARRSSRCSSASRRRSVASILPS